MPYQFALDRPDYSDLASGRVLYSLPGHPAFPIRLADEILQRCLARRAANRLEGPCVLYDPCCGVAYHLTVLASLHWNLIRQVIGSDVDEKAVRLAGQNLGLLSLAGLEKRVQEISQMLGQYGKESHREALGSACKLRDRIAALAEKHTIQTGVFQANALDGAALRKNLGGVAVDIVFVDVPYGQHSQWRLPDSISGAANPLWGMLDALLTILQPTSLVAVVSDKRQKAVHAGYQRLEQFQVGKRRVAIFRSVLAHR